MRRIPLPSRPSGARRPHKGATPWILTVTLALLGATAQPAFAQAVHTIPAGARVVRDTAARGFFKALALSAEQKTALATLTARTAAARQSIVGTQAGTFTLTSKQMASLRQLAERHNVEFRGILDARQRELFDAERKRRTQWQGSRDAAMHQSDPSVQVIPSSAKPAPTPR